MSNANTQMIPIQSQVVMLEAYIGPKPDSIMKKSQREEVIDEVQYSEFVKLFEDTYFKEMYDALTKKYKLGRVRLLWKLPRTTLSWHRDPRTRLHIPIVTNFGAPMCIDEVIPSMPSRWRSMDPLTIPKYVRIQWWRRRQSTSCCHSFGLRYVHFPIIW